MRVLMDIELVDCERVGDHICGHCINGIFLVRDKVGTTFIVVREGSETKKIELDNENRSYILWSYDEAKERKERYTALREIHECILRGFNNQEKAYKELNKSFKEAITGLAVKLCTENEAEERNKEMKSGYISEQALLGLIDKLLPETKEKRSER